MSLEIFIDSYAAEGRITKMIDKLQVVPVPAELTAWQLEDMKRRYPHTQEINATAALTMIYPRSRRTVSLRKRGVRLNKPLRRGRAIRVAGKTVAVKRPILRPELFDRLCERMAALLKREAAW